MNPHNALKKLPYLLLTLCLIFLPSCEEEDPEAEAWFSGTWYVVDYSYGCPYEFNDTFVFYPDGNLRIIGWNYERGYWEIRTLGNTSRLYIYFVGDRYYPTITGEFDNVGRSYIRLYVQDQDYGEYWLVLRRVPYPYRRSDAPADSTATASPSTLPARI